MVDSKTHMAGPGHKQACSLLIAMELSFKEIAVDLNLAQPKQSSDFLNR